MPNMPRVQEFLLPLLREEFPQVHFYSWHPRQEEREFPMVTIRRQGGLSNPENPLIWDRPVVETTVFHTELIDAERLAMDIREFYFKLVQSQVVYNQAYLHDYFETFGPSQFESTFPDTFRFQFLTQLQLRTVSQTQGDN